MKITVEINQPPRNELIGKHWDGMMCVLIEGKTDICGMTQSGEFYKYKSIETWISGNWDEALYPELKESPFKV